MKPNNTELAKLEAAVLANSPRMISMAHEGLLGRLHGRGPAPDWDLYPVGRDYWLQHDPVPDWRTFMAELRPSA